MNVDHDHKLFSVLGTYYNYIHIILYKYIIDRDNACLCIYHKNVLI